MVIMKISSDNDQNLFDPNGGVSKIFFEYHLKSSLKQETVYHQSSFTRQEISLVIRLTAKKRVSKKSISSGLDNTVLIPSFIPC